MSAFLSRLPWMVRLRGMPRSASLALTAAPSRPERIATGDPLALRELDGEAIARRESLEVLAARAVDEARVCEHAVDVEHDRAHGPRTCQELLPG